MTQQYARLILILFACRLTINTAIRVGYPLLAWLAASFAVDLQTISLIITVQLAATFVGPFGGMLADRYGERLTMLLGLGMLCLGAACGVLASQIELLLLGHMLLGASAGFYHAASHAYLSATTPYAVRGRILGIMEASWALAALIGVSSLVTLVRFTGQVQSLYAVLLLLGMGMLLAVLLGVPPLPHTRSDPTSHHSHPTLSIWQIVRLRFIAIFIIFLIGVMTAYETVFVVYGAWLEQDFNASLEQIGLVFGLLGLIELGGSAGAAMLTDRLGKRRAVLLGFGLTGLMQLVLITTAGNWLGFLVVFLLMGLLAEFSIVSVIIMSSGMLARARTTTIATTLTATSIGRVLGSLLGPALFVAAGFTANGLVAGTLTLLCVLGGLWLVREGEEATPPEPPRPVPAPASGTPVQGE